MEHKYRWKSVMNVIFWEKFLNLSSLKYYCYHLNSICFNQFQLSIIRLINILCHKILTEFRLMILMEKAFNPHFHLYVSCFYPANWSLHTKIPVIAPILYYLKSGKEHLASLGGQSSIDKGFLLFEQ